MRLKLALALLLAALVAAFFVFDLGRFLSLQQVKSAQADLARLYAERPLQVAGGFFAIYTAVAALSLPGAVILTLLAGAVFGLGVGTVLVSFASSIGATVAMLSARFLLRGWVQGRLGKKLADVDRGIARDGAYYLFTLRLVPVFPFFVINLLAGLTAIGPLAFYVASQLGMLAGTLVFVNAGTQLAQVESLRGIFTPGLVASFVLLGVFPLLARWVVGAVAARRVYAPWAGRRPRRYDRNLVVIGAGAAGLVTSVIAAAVKSRVTLVEGQRMGGDCLHTGCVPSKALIRTATLVHRMRHPGDHGIAPVEPSVDFAEVMEHVRGAVRTIEPHDSVERYEGLGVDVRIGHARIVDPWHVQITAPDGAEAVLSTRAIVIATGARPTVPPLPGLDDVGFLTSDTLWDLRTLPRRLVVLGGGPIGCELAQAFARLGSQVTQIEMAPRLLVREDEDVSALVRQALEADGVRVLVGHRAVRCERTGDDGRAIVLEADGQAQQRIGFDRLLCAVGRSARLTGFGLEELGIAVGRTVEVDERLQTRFPNILAAGDVAGPYQFTHTAAHQAWYAAVNGLFGSFKTFKVDTTAIPWCTFTDPEVARVGLDRQQAREQNIPCEVTRYPLSQLDRAIADGATAGWVQVLTVPGRDRILGVTIVGAHAGELLAEWVLAMQHGLGLNKVLGTIHAYPTWADANKQAAGVWKRAHAPQAVLRWAERFHAMRRG